MRRFAVDVEGINLEDDLALEDRALAAIQGVPRGKAASLQQQAAATGVDHDAEAVPHLLSADFVVDVKSTLQLAQDAREAASVGLIRAVPSSPSPMPATLRQQRIRDVRVFCNFLVEKGKKCSFNVRLKDSTARGVDVVEAAIKAFLTADDKTRGKYSENPRHYKLFMADDNTGEEEAPIQLDSGCANFTCLSLQPQAHAMLYLFPVKSSLLAAPPDDVSLQVEIRSGHKASKRLVTAPADLLVDKFESFLLTKLHKSKVERGSLRVRYGPLELAVGERYDFGSGCGTSEVTVGEWTLHSIVRFGVTEVCVGGQLEDEAELSTSEGNIDNIKRIDEEEARAYQQFEVTKINKFGVRQQRIIGVDGERVYNMRPLSEVGKTKNPERLIEDIEVVRDYRDRPTYCEIEYNKASKYDTDRFECRNAYDCAMLVEKLKMLKRIHSRRQDMKRTDTTISRLFSKFGFGK